jgi:acetyl-CoA carboxylase biotin carboxylase subunit
MSSPGKITTLILPGGPGVRIDSHVYAGYTIPPFYDSMILKLLTNGVDRAEAISKMRRALDELKIEGIKTTTEFHKKVMNTETFAKGEVYTNFIDTNFK